MFHRTLAGCSTRSTSHIRKTDRVPRACEHRSGMSDTEYATRIERVTTFRIPDDLLQRSDPIAEQPRCVTDDGFYRRGSLLQTLHPQRACVGDGSSKAMNPTAAHFVRRLADKRSALRLGKTFNNVHHDGERRG